MENIFGQLELESLSRGGTRVKLMIDLGKALRPIHGKS
jgi:hypothetical protein